MIQSIANEKTDHEWNAVFIENEYIKVMVLPELGVRIQMAYDKIKQRHFVYYNHVIKPALVGLAGPWISGGIEFNWPQHHRPSTYMPADCTIEERPDGSVTVWVGETERMTHQKGMAGFTLRPGCARLEIEGVLYNPTDIPWYIRKGRFDLAEEYLKKAVKVLMRRNPNPYDGEPIYNLGVALKYQERYDEAYERFYKSTWNGAWQDAGYLACARISALQGRDDDAPYETERCLCRHYHNHRARTLRAALLLRTGRKDEAIALCDESIAIDPFNFGCIFVKWQSTNDAETLRSLMSLMREDSHNYEELSEEFIDGGDCDAALKLLDLCNKEGALGLMGLYLMALCLIRKCDKEKAIAVLEKAASADPSRCYPNSLYSIIALKAALEGRYADAVDLLEQCLEYPEHFGEGKLYGAQENDFYYLLGLCRKTLGDEEKAQECFLKATEGPTDPAAAMYYNDAKPDKIFYAGMALRQLAKEDKARAYFNRLVNYGRQHFHDDVRMDYFAVSLPDLLIWE